MVSKIFSSCLSGLFAQIIEVEAAASQGLRSFSIVGLGDKAITEAKERVGQAIKSAGLKPPQNQTLRVLINLAPADLKKEGSLYDLPIALAYLIASKQINFLADKKIVLGELALDGRLKPIKGALSFALLAQEKGFGEIILPKSNANEAGLASLLKQNNKLKVRGAENLKQVIAHLENKTQIPETIVNPEVLNQKDNFEIDFGWIKGQSHAKKGLELAAAGGHNILLQGPPGAGKSLLAKAIVSILPKLDIREMLELTKIYSASGLLSENMPFITRRPIRSPHHTCSEAALIGGGNPPRPGEITLSHRGILFLDEFPEFHRDVLESLRGPMEQGIIGIQRARNFLTYPARFSLVAAANPCPCGYKDDPERECICSGSQIASYRRKLSGPLMDRIDIFISVPAVKYKDLIEPSQEKESAHIKSRIELVRAIQKERFKEDGILTNAEMQIPQIKKYCRVSKNSQALLKKVVDSGKLSARGFHRVLKVARTLADLEQQKNISSQDISETLSYRLRSD